MVGSSVCLLATAFTATTHLEDWQPSPPGSRLVSGARTLAVASGLIAASGPLRGRRSRACHLRCNPAHGVLPNVEGIADDSDSGPAIHLALGLLLMVAPALWREWRICYFCQVHRCESAIRRIWEVSMNHVRAASTEEMLGPTRLAGRDRRTGAAVAASIPALAGLLVAISMPRGRVTTLQALTVKALSLLVGVVAGLALRSRRALAAFLRAMLICG
jgi:hypothetical protein